MTEITGSYGKFLLILLKDSKLFSKMAVVFTFIPTIPENSRKFTSSSVFRIVDIKKSAILIVIWQYLMFNLYSNH